MLVGREGGLRRRCMMVSSLVGVVMGMRVRGHGGLDSAGRSPVAVGGDKGG
jgi:hypothetical protein